MCDFVSNKKSGLNIHMSRKHAVIEQLDGIAWWYDKLDPESDDYNIAEDPNYEQRTFLSYCSSGRKVSTMWIRKGAPRWGNQILPFEPGHILR